jgi:hypothetical protein
MVRRPPSNPVRGEITNAVTVAMAVGLSGYGSSGITRRASSAPTMCTRMTRGCSARLTNLKRS